MHKDNKLNFTYESAEQVELAFYEVFGEGNFPLMESLFAENGVTYSHLGDTEIIGRKKVIDNWQFILTDIPKVNINRDILNVSRNAAIETHLVLESFVIDKKTGKTSKIITTNTFIEQSNGWRLQTQTSSLPS